MVSTFTDKFRQDLELIYAKYSNPFDGAPELTLSTCDLPENIKLIEGYTYSNCGKWKILGGSSDDVCEDDSSLDNSTSDEENQFSSYDSEDSLSSNCSGSFQVEKSFRDCTKRSDSSMVSPSKSTLKKSDKHDNLLHKILYDDHEDKQATGKTILAKNTGYSSDEVEYFKPQATITISKDLWSHVQQSLRLMTRVFTQLNSESNDGNTMDLGEFCSGKTSRDERSKNPISRSVVKEKLFDNNASKSRASIPQGQVLEKLFVRHKGSKTPGIELSSRQTFHHSTSKISKIECLDSGFCHENSSDLDVSTQEYNSTSPCNATVDGPGHKTLVSQTSIESGDESASRKSLLVNRSMKAFDSCKPLSFARICHAPTSWNDATPCFQQQPPEFKSLSGHSSQTLSGKKRRYRLVRRRQRQSTSETPTSGHETESDTRGHEGRKEHSFDLSTSDSENFHVRTKIKKTTTNDHKPYLHCSSSDMDDVILMKAPQTPELQNEVNLCEPPNFAQYGGTPGNKNLLLTEIPQEHCRSSTPRKNVYPRVNNTTTNSRHPDVYLRQTACEKRCSTPVDSMPSPIKSSLNSNTLLTENSLKINSNFTSDVDHLSPKPRNVPKDSLPIPCISKSMRREILQPQIPINFLTTKQIPNKCSSYIRTIKTQNNDGTPTKIFPSLPASSKERFSASCGRLLTSHRADGLSKQRNVQQECSKQHLHLTPSAVVSARRTGTVCCTAPFLEQADEEKYNSRIELCATDTLMLGSPITALHNSKGSLTRTEPSTNHPERKAKATTSDKRNKHNHSSEQNTGPSENPLRSLQQKTPPRRAKFHPYAAYNKFPRSPVLSSTFRDLTIKSPSYDTRRWTTLDRSPMAIRVMKARRISDPVLASRKILEFGAHGPCGDIILDNEETSPKPRDDIRVVPIRNRNTSQETLKTSDLPVEDDISDCSSGKCTKMFCFNCSMDLAK